MLTDPRHSPIGTPTAWEPLTHNTANQATGGIWRVTGPGGTAILKHATPTGQGAAHWPASTDPRHWNYWQREYLAYTTGYAAQYGKATGLGAPALLAAGQRPDGSRELWLDNVTGTPGPDWTTTQLADLAHHLGATQAQLANAPELPWHSRRFLRTYAGRRDFPDIPWNHPLAAAHWDADLRDGLRMIWEKRTELFTLAETLPQTRCHLDLWPLNLIWPTSKNGPVLLDWSFTGTGAIGEDIANLIADTFLDGLQPVHRLPQTETALTNAYLTGLNTTAHHNETTVRKAIAATGAAKYCWLAPTMLTSLANGTPTTSADYDTETDNAAVLDRRAPILTMLVRWAHTALDN